MAVKEIKFRNAKPREKAYKIPAERGLHMLVKPKRKRMVISSFQYLFMPHKKLKQSQCRAHRFPVVAHKSIELYLRQHPH